jgi:hypothetical protein
MQTFITLINNDKMKVFYQFETRGPGDSVMRNYDEYETGTPFPVSCKVRFDSARSIYDLELGNQASSDLAAKQHQGMDWLATPESLLGLYSDYTFED